jgi:hypothetical protein
MNFPFKELNIQPEPNGILSSNTRPRRNTRLPVKLQNYIVEVPVIHPILPIIRTKKKLATRACIKFYIPHLLNSGYLVPNAREKTTTHSLKGFVTYTKKTILDNYEIACTTANCYVCGNQ